MERRTIIGATTVAAAIPISALSLTFARVSFALGIGFVVWLFGKAGPRF